MKKNGVEVEDVLYEDLTIPVNAFDLKDYTNSHYFLLPLFDLTLPIKHLDVYVNSYIGDSEREANIEHALHVLFKFASLKDPLVQTITEQFEVLNNHKMTYYAGHNNGELICFVMKADDSIKDCYNTLIEGRYSEIEPRYYAKYQDFPFSRNVKKRLQGIFRKEAWHKREIEKLMNAELDSECELWVGFEPEREIFRLEKDTR